MDDLNKLADGGYVYAILDACDAPAVPEKARSLGDEQAGSLYNGTAQEDYWAIAPYLCKADRGLIQWIQNSLWVRISRWESAGVISFRAAGLFSWSARLGRWLRE